jgi:hypothetical protein
LPVYDSTCAFLTINYITHTLPQQCWKTSWSAPTQTAGLQETGATSDAVWAGIPWAREVTKGNEAASGQNESYAAAGGVSETQTQTGPTSTGTTKPEAEAETESETDSPLDHADFLSFEEWKKRNLARAGQSAETVGQGRAASADSRARRRPVNINALDALGEESEINLDFSGFGDTKEESGSQDFSSRPGAAQEAAQTSEDEGKVAPGSFPLSKDAGKTCKERFNYASFDCAATVLKTNSKAKSATSVLVENKDSYMLNECSADNKFLIVELCDDILVDTVVLANYEFFSSMFRQFRVSVSDRYPVKMDRWRILGEFEARNSRDIQAFLIREPEIWARYLRIEFFNHYGNEFYCPVSLLRVHGTTMMEQFKREEEQARGVHDFAEPIEAAAGGDVQTAVVVASDSATTRDNQQPVDSDKSQDSVSGGSHNLEKTAEQADAAETSNSSISAVISHPPAPSDVKPSVDTPITQATNQSEKVRASSATEFDSESSNGTTASEPSVNNQKNGSDVAAPTAEAPQSVSSPTNNGGANEPVKSSEQEKKVASGTSAGDTSTVHSGSSSVKATTDSTATGGQAQAQSQQRAVSYTPPNPPPPSTQESWFGTMHKRLQRLEANSNDSLQYIEEQSRMLRDALLKVEKRQLQKTEKFLDHLNSTVMQELKTYRAMYEQLWQSVVLELEGIKHKHNLEISEIGNRLSIVAEELVWQKRMILVQSTVLMLCLVLVLFRSGSMGSQSDIPLAQQLRSKYTRSYDSPPRSPDESAGIFRRRRTFRNMWRSDTSIVTAVSDIDTEGPRSPAQVVFRSPSPDTPVSASYTGTDNGSSPAQGTGADESPTSSDEGRRVEALATQSGPATPRGSRDTRPSWDEVDRAVHLLKAGERDQGGKRKRKNKRSPLRRSESYDTAAVEENACDDDTETRSGSV